MRKFKRELLKLFSEISDGIINISTSMDRIKSAFSHKDDTYPINVLHTREHGKVN